LTLLATSRKGEDLGFSARKDQELRYRKLDISDPESIASFRRTIHGDKQVVDVIINNAGVNLDDDFSFANTKKTLDTNYRGTLEMCKAFIPLMREGSNETGRIVNLSSVASSLKTWKPDLAGEMRKISTLDELEGLVQSYLSHVKAGDDAEAGFPSERSYSVSKAGINILTSILAKQTPNLTINCCCPGWIDTEMGDLVSTRKVRPPKTPEEGGRIPFKLGFGDVQGVSGRYWANDSVRSKEDGKPQEW
jgi:carbonyl reductase 1